MLKTCSFNSKITFHLRYVIIANYASFLQLSSGEHTKIDTYGRLDSSLPHNVLVALCVLFITLTPYLGNLSCYISEL
jgi:hypothetical protein